MENIVRPITVATDMTDEMAETDGTDVGMRRTIRTIRLRQMGMMRLMERINGWGGTRKQGI